MEGGQEAVVVAGGDVVVLVVVAADAAEGQAEEAGPDRGEGVVEFVVAVAEALVLHERAGERREGAGGEEAGRVAVRAEHRHRAGRVPLVPLVVPRREAEVVEDHDGAAGEAAAAPGREAA